MREFEVKDFCLEDILLCGQCFRWEKKENGSFVGIAGDKAAILTQRGNQLNIEGEGTSKFWENYFDLSRDYGAIKKLLLKRDKKLKNPISFGSGIRILRQEPWETLVSFIISSNNNIPRIKKNIQDIASSFGKKCGELEGTTYYSLPTPEQMAQLKVEDLAHCKLGYRGNYLIKTAKAVQQQGSVQEGNLLSYFGVGPKVADCVGLFGFQQYDRFPIDTWVKQVMRERYHLEGEQAIHKFTKERYGEYAGIAQQYLFYYVRENKRNSS